MHKMFISILYHLVTLKFVNQILFLFYTPAVLLSFVFLDKVIRIPPQVKLLKVCCLERMMRVEISHI